MAVCTLKLQFAKKPREEEEKKLPLPLYASVYLPTSVRHAMELTEVVVLVLVLHSFVTELFKPITPKTPKNRKEALLAMQYCIWCIYVFFQCMLLEGSFEMLQVMLSVFYIVSKFF